MSKKIKKVWLYLENGLYLEAKSFGADATSVGEIIFNTSMSGFEEIITDPASAGDFITLTMPEIGNTGANKEDMQSKEVHAKGVIVRKYQVRYSNFRAECSLESFLIEHNLIGICDIDTRYLTELIRDEGVMKMVASTEISDKEQLKQILDSSLPSDEIDFQKDIGTKKPYKHTQARYSTTEFKFDKAPKAEAKVIVIDFGAKESLLNELVEAKMEVEVVPSSFDADDLISKYRSKDIDGICLSSGPGNPMMLTNQHQEIKKLIEAKVPMFGYGLGHQLLTIAQGYEVFRLKSGHHGANQPVKSLKTGSIEISSQNHIYNISPKISEIADITHVNLFDNSIEGVEYRNAPIISIQYEPESTPSLGNNINIFDRFLEKIKRA